MSERPRLLVYDEDAKPKALPVLWSAGPAVMPFDYVLPIRRWSDLPPLIERELPEGILLGEVQYWCHGTRGTISMGGGNPNWRDLREAYGSRLVTSNSVLEPTIQWARCCDGFGGSRGFDLAEELVSVFRHPWCGHTFVVSESELNIFGIHIPKIKLPSQWQSGGHILHPGCPPHWPKDEGVGEGGLSQRSGKHKPNTCTIFTKTPPKSWRDEANAALKKYLESQRA